LKIEGQPLKHHVLQVLDLKLKVFETNGEGSFVCEICCQNQKLAADTGCVKRLCIKQNTLATS
jgi:hypothetical protein